MDDPVINTNNKTPHVIIVLILIALGFSIYKFYDLPQSVKSNFETLYPQIVEYEWEPMNGNYEIIFSIDSMNERVLFDSKGNLLKLIAQINQDDVPKIILDRFHDLYPDFSIGETREIQIGDSIDFTIKAHNGNRGVELIFGRDGQLIEQDLYRGSAKGEPNR